MARPHEQGRVGLRQYGQKLQFFFILCGRLLRTVKSSRTN